MRQRSVARAQSRSPVGAIGETGLDDLMGWVGPVGVEKYW